MDILDDKNSIDLPSEGQIDLETKYDAALFPSLVTRVKALFIDVVIILIIFTATALFIGSVGDIPDFVKGFILIFMFYLYDPILT